MLLLALGGTDPAHAAIAQRAYLASQNPDRIVIVEATKEVQAPPEVAIDGAPTDVAVHPDGTSVFAASPATDTIWEIGFDPGDPSNAFGKPINDPDLAAPTFVDITSDGKLLFVLNAKSRTVSVIETSSRSVMATTPPLQDVGVFTGLAVEPGRARAWITHAASQTLIMVDLDTKDIRSFELPFPPFSLAVHPKGLAVYVTYDNPRISIFDVESSKLTTVALHPELTDSFWSRGLDVLPDGSRLVVGTRSPDAVRVYDLAPSGALGKCQNMVRVGKEPLGVSASVKGDRAYVATSEDLASNRQRLYVIDPTPRADAPQWCDVKDDASLPAAVAVSMLEPGTRANAWNRFTAPSVASPPTTSTISTTTVTTTTAAPSSTTSTSTLTTSTSAPVSTTTSSTTTASPSTLPVSLCGNGRVDPGEECDDVQNGCCDAATCRFRPVDLPCGDPSANDCDRPDTCDGHGACASNHTRAATKCGTAPVGKRSACDPGSICDGVHAACVVPDQSAGCDIDLADDAPPEGTTLDCFAPDPGAGKTRCTVTGVEAPAGAAPVARGAARRKRPVIQKQKAAFVSLSPDGRRLKTLPLRLNKRGQKVFADRGQITVDLTVTIGNGKGRQATSRTVQRLIRFRR